MRKLILISLMTFSLFSCNSDEIKGGSSNSAIVDVSLDMKITNSKGEDLLNSKTQGSYDSSKIKLFYLEGSDLKEVYDGNMDYPRNFFVYERDGFFIIRVFLNSYDKEQYAKTIIQWNEKDRDTIKAEFRRPSGSIFKKNIWYNEDLVTSDLMPYLNISK